MQLKTRYDLFVFDLDGTLIDSRQDIARSANATLAFLGKAPLSEDKVASFVGSGVRQLMRDLLTADGKKTTHDEIDRAHVYFMDHYGKHCTNATRFYPGVEACLAALRDKKLAVLTNKPESLSIDILTELHALALFSPVIGGDSLPRKKPDPEGLVHIMNHHRISPNRTLMIGDSSIDVETATRAGCDSLAIFNGFGSRQTFRKLDATWTFENFADILAAL